MPSVLEALEGQHPQNSPTRGLEIRSAWRCSQVGLGVLELVSVAGKKRGSFKAGGEEPPPGGVSVSSATAAAPRSRSPPPRPSLALALAAAWLKLGAQDFPLDLLPPWLRGDHPSSSPPSSPSSR